MEELARQNAEQRELLVHMAESWRSDSARNREGTLAATRETANEQVPCNVQGVSHLNPAAVPESTQGLARQNAGQRESLAQVTEGWKNYPATREESFAAIHETANEQVPGGCLCRATTYMIPKPPRNIPEDFNWEANYIVPGGKNGSNKWAASHCYCDSCQVSVGTLVATWFSVPRAQFRLQNKGPTGVYRSSSHGTREFVSLSLSPPL